MKKTFTILIAAIAAIMLITSPLVSKGQVAPVNTILWAEDFSGYAANNVPTGPITNSHTGTTVWGEATLTYSVENGGGTTKIYVDTQMGGSTNQPNLLIAKGNGTFTVSNIPTGSATELTLSYDKTGDGIMSVSVSSTPSGATISGSTITTNGASTISITFKNTKSNKNLRFDNAQVKVKTASAAPTITITTPLNLAPNAVTDGVMTASYSSITPTSGSVTLWNNSACTEEFTGDETGLWLTAEFGTKATDFEKINYTVDENNTGSVRTAYMKVAVSGTSKVDAYKVVTITQNTFQTVTFHGHGGYYDENDKYTQKIPKSVATDLELNKFVKAGSYFFKEWTTDVEGEGVSYEDGEEVTLTDDLDLYAQWDEGYTVSLNSNGVITNKGVKKGESLTLTAPNNVPSGFVYKGWTATSITPNTLVATEYTPEDDITLYAAFARINSISYDKVSKLDDVTEGEYIITSYYSSTYYTITNGLQTTGTASAPTQTVVDGPSITGNVSTKTWTFTGSTSSMTIKSTQNNTYYLNSTNTAKGIYVNTTSDTWNITFDNTEKCFKMSSSNGGDRYLSLYTSGVDWRNYSNGTSNSYSYLTLFKKTENLSSEYYVRVFQDETLTAATTINGPSIIPSGKILNAGSYLTNGTAANLVIEDGGQLITTTGASVKATVKKNVTTWSASPVAGWLAISSPVDNFDFTEGGNFIPASGNYTMYAYDEKNCMWINSQSGGTTGFSTFNKGQGYLYRKTNNTAVEIAGTLVTSNFDYSLSCSGKGSTKGFNLIGNPYAHNIYKGTSCAIPNTYLKNGFYILTSAGGFTLGTDGTTPIAPGQSILVQVKDDAESPKVAFTNTPNADAGKTNQDNIVFKVANSQYEDVTCAMFDKGEGINKINHRNEDIPMIYIPQNGKNYALAMFSDFTEAFELSFKAATTGVYTLSYTSKGEFNYLHVIDRLTGADIDMLLDGEYKFIGTPSDTENRFIVRLAYMPDYSGGNNDIFAFQSGSEIYVSGEGELQIFDVTGRFVMSERINGATSISADALSKGVYVLRIVGSEIKTQKIVVR